MGDVAYHYNASSPTYSEQYDKFKIVTSEEYPANYFRLDRTKKGVRDIERTSTSDLVNGDGSPLAAMTKERGD